MKPQIINADAVAWADAYTGSPFQALLADAPYHLQSIVDRFGKQGAAPAKEGTDGLFQRVSKGFAGKQWDGGDIAFRKSTWEAFARILHPGAFLMVYGGARTYHRMAVAMEDAGLIVGNPIAWLKQHSMPKATRLDVQLDRAAGHPHTSKEAPVTALAEAWAGHRYGGQPLKPMFEFIALAQKPYAGKPINSIVETGAGALNIEGARHNKPLVSDWIGNPGGSWPGNAILEHKPGCKPVGAISHGYTINRFDDGMKPFGNGAGHEYNSNQAGLTELEWECEPGCEAGLQGRSKQFGQSGWIFEQLEFAHFRYEQKVSKAEANLGVGADNEHPTLKSIALNRWLATLLLPPDNVCERRIFNPFGGVGSEAIGAMLAGWETVVSVELEKDYADIADKRVEAWYAERDAILAGATIKQVATGRAKRSAPLPGQISLFGL